MNFQPEYLYHVYNRGNNSQLIFFKDENYFFFLRKIKKELLPYCDFLAYCLMPTHFHFMVYVKPPGIGLTAPSGLTDYHPLVKGIAKLLSSYSQAINKQEGRTGGLFQKKTKAKMLTYPSDRSKRSDGFERSDGYPDNYAFNCFNYIHQNPLKAGLVKDMLQWQFSSYNDYSGLCSESLCNKKLTFEFIPFLNNKNFRELSSKAVSQESEKGLY